MRDQSVLERILKGNEEPRDLPLALLQDITNDFCEERKIGQGGFGEVYKGVLRNGLVVAVKRIHVNEDTIDDKLFRREFNSLWKANNHRNVVRFLGFCSNSYHTTIVKPGSEEEIKLASVRERLLCFEYISNGSLDKHITDELRGLEWETRYDIITGICKGLFHLKEKSIFHMDLKPANILLDDNMVPKITDFGLSRPKENSHTTGQRFGTRGYLAPEYENAGRTSFECDIYSLGAIIIELVTGCMNVPHKNNVFRRWRHRWNKPPTLLQYQQVSRCIDIAVRCRKQESEARPSILEIISFLGKSESTDVHAGQVSPCFDEDDMLGIKPLEVRLPYVLKEEISCSIELTNGTRNCIAFNIQLPRKQRYIAQPYKGIVQPESKYGVKITVEPGDVHEHGHANKFIVQSMKVGEGIRDEDITERMFKEASKVVDEVNLMVVYEPTEPQENCKSREDTNMPAKEVPEVINACREFFSWVTPGIIAARHQLLDKYDTAAQHQIHEVREQLWQLKNDLWKLQTTMAPKMLDLIDRVEWQSHKKPAADLLPEIKDAMYDAEDLLDEFNYYVMKLGVEQSKNSGQDHMEGAFLRFYNSIKDCAHFSKVKEIQDKLDHIYEQSKDLGLHQAPQKFDRSIRPETCSFSDEPQIFGREKELEQMVQKLGVNARKRHRTDGEERMTELPVLPIVGMGGVGKTTMAQQICNDANVIKHFDCVVWTCVSDDFDIKRLTREILRHLGEQTHPDDNLNILMSNLADCVKSKMFLLVLDDMWDDILKEGGAVWKRFCKPLENGSQGSMILVTTRSSEVANLVGTMNHYELQGLPIDVFWKFFKLQAFGFRSSSNYPELEHIGKAILPKLKRSPLAAKTIGRLLSRDLNTRHWKYILDSELWQLDQYATDILPALRLSYMYLPPHLKKCFSICAMYSKDHVFVKEDLVHIWIAHGYVQPQEASFCFDDLANRSFFQRVSQRSDNEFVIHDLIHDTAQLVSKDECFIIKHPRDVSQIPLNVRHLSILTGNLGRSELNNICNKKKLRSLVCNVSHDPNNFSAVIDSWFRELLKIRVLSFNLSVVIPQSMANLKHLRYLRVFSGTLPSSIVCLHYLQTIEARGCKFESFPQGFRDVISLQKMELTGLDYNKDHFDRLFLRWPPTNRISGEKQVQMMEELPHWNLQHLEIEDYRGGSCPSWLQPNLLPWLRSLKFLFCWNIQSISFFEPLGREEVSDNIHRLEELSIKYCSSLTYIRVSEASTSSSVGAFSSLARLTIYCCRGLLSLDEFLTPAYLPAVKSIRIESCPELTSLRVDRLYGFSCLEEMSIYHCPKLNKQRVMRLPSSLKNLSLVNCGGTETIDFHRLGSSPALELWHVEDCPDLRSIGVSVNVGAFSSVARLTIRECARLLSLNQLLTPAYLPAVKNIRIESCPELTSLPVDRLHGFSCMEQLFIAGCRKLSMQMVMRLPSSLKDLWLERCGGIETIDFHLLGSTPALKRLHIYNCPDLRTIGGSVIVAQAENVLIYRCPQLTEIDQPFRQGLYSGHLMCFNSCPRS